MPINLQYSSMTNADTFSNLKSEPINFNTSGDNVLLEGIVSKKIYCYRLYLVVADDTELTFKDGILSDLSGPLPMLANGAMVLDLSNVPWYQTSSGNDFILNSTSDVQVSGTLYYQQT